MKNLVTVFLAISFAFLFVTDACAQVDSDNKPKLRDKIEPVQLKEKDTSKKSDSKTEKQSKPASVESLKKATRSSSTSDVSLPVRMASTTTGLILGYPIAVARCLYKETKDGTKDFVGSSTNPVFVVPAALISFPFAVFGSPFEGLGYSAFNSWRGSGEEPFGRDTFSLGDWD